MLKNTLGRLPLFVDCLDQDFQMEVFPVLKPVSYLKGEIVFKRGETLTLTLTLTLTPTLGTQACLIPQGGDRL